MNPAPFTDRYPAAVSEPVVRTRVLHPGVRRIEDSHHPRGYREPRSPAEMRKLLNRKIIEQNGICPICLEEFTAYNDVVPYADIGIRCPTILIRKEWEERGETITGQYPSRSLLVQRRKRINQNG
jgi:hypothetical protein